MPKPQYSEGDEPFGACSDCGESCSGILVDFGIGPYEYGSYSGCDEMWLWSSPCCEAEILPEEEPSSGKLPAKFSLDPRNLTEESEDEY